MALKFHLKYYEHIIKCSNKKKKSTVAIDIAIYSKLRMGKQISAAKRNKTSKCKFNISDSKNKVKKKDDWGESKEQPLHY